MADKIKQAADDETKASPAKMGALFDLVLAQVTEALAGLEPEDAVVTFDSVTYKVEDTGGNKADYALMVAVLANMLGASLKTPASVSGMCVGRPRPVQRRDPDLPASGARHPLAGGRVDVPCGDLACRLQRIDGRKHRLRVQLNQPASRHRAGSVLRTRQKRVLELLSWGVINEAHACWELGIRPQVRLDGCTGWDAVLRQERIGRDRHGSHHFNWRGTGP